MDFHLLVVIACVFFASLCSLLFINKFLRRKTFEEIVAEKRAETKKIKEAVNKAEAATGKKPRKMIIKKDLKREKKHRHKEQPTRVEEQEQEDLDILEEDIRPGLSKIHVEFEPEPEMMTYENDNLRRISNAEREHSSGGKSKSNKKEKNSGGAIKVSGILLNKNESIVKRENVIFASAVTNNFEAKQPKDAFELKKHEKDKKEELIPKPHPVVHQAGKKEKHIKKEKQINTGAAEKMQIVERSIATEVSLARDMKQPDDKVRQSSPKSSSSSNTKKQQQKKNNNKDSTKDLIVALDKLSANETISVQLLMNLFRRSELNRSDIQLLIDYLLNKQQDTPATHSEWSDDICQKLKRQLEEKERLLSEEQEASIGIQAKLRELRTEINAERAQMNSTLKMYAEKLQSKEQDIVGMNQELQALNEKISLERQQFQSKLLREKQAGSQELLSQLQLMQNELSHKDKCINELTCMVSATRTAADEESQQRNDIIQAQAQKILVLEQQRDDLEQVSNNRIFELENLKTLESENTEDKVEICNLQNALESCKADLARALADVELKNGELDNARTVLQAQSEELSKELAKRAEGMEGTLIKLKGELNAKELQLNELEAKSTVVEQKLEQSNEQHAEHTRKQKEVIARMTASLQEKDKQLDNLLESATEMKSKETELLQQLHEQREKNNDLRKKNWKLVEALQNAEARVHKMNSSDIANLVQQQQHLESALETSSALSEHRNTDVSVETQVREILSRLYPNAVQACASTALSISFDQWIEQVLQTISKQSNATATNTTNATTNTAKSSSSNKATQLTNSCSENNNHTNSAHNNSTQNSLLNNNGRESKNNSSSNIGDSSGESAEMQRENAELRIKIDELTKLIAKTSNTLSEVEGRAREQDEYWRNVLRSKDEEISTLRHSNGEQGI